VSVDSLQTPLSALIARLRSCASTSGDSEAPAAILWPDPSSQWLPLLDSLLEALPELVVLGDHDPEKRTGPAIWVRCVIDGTLAEPELPADRPPIVLMPGVARQQLRAGEDCPDWLQPLVELMWRGSLWLQQGGRDWTVPAFLSTTQGLGLDVARDEQTKAALMRALPEVAATPIVQLQGRRLEAEDFDRLLAGDVVRDVLRWMGDPGATRARMNDGSWGAFVSRCREELGFAPDEQADVDAGVLLGLGEGAWKTVWDRFCESPSSYPGIEQLLSRSQPSGTLPFRREPWPNINESDETELRQALSEIPALGHEAACLHIEELDDRHAERRDWVWARIERAPLAMVLEPLRRLAGVVQRKVAGSSLDEIASDYTDRGWLADQATWQCMAACTVAHQSLIAKVVQHLVTPWLDDSARVLQRVLENEALPSPLEQGVVEADEDGCILFADGLRYDLGRRLADRLEAAGLRAKLRTRWTAAPTVTATAKPAVTPVANLVRGNELREDFGAELAPEGRAADARNLRNAMQAAGYQILGSDTFDVPENSPARGWLETGEIDELGHKLGSLLARQLDDEVERLANRINGLFEAGWESVRVVTDHGWLLVPGGLPRVDLPKHLTASRWARCAVISGDSHADAPRFPWTWDATHSFAYAPGIACFNKSDEYAHGGLSIQECLTPDLYVERGESKGTRVTIDAISWKGMRCYVDASVRGSDITADLRLAKANGASVVATPKAIEDGEVRLVLDGDEHEDDDLVLVLLDSEGTILAQRATKVGVDS
jgi:hypothetical protein